MSVEGQLDFTNGRAFLCRNHPVAMNHLPYSNESRLFGARQIRGYLQFFLCLLRFSFVPMFGVVPSNAIGKCVSLHNGSSTPDG